MRTLLAVLGVVGLVIIIVGAVNHAIGVRIDYLVGTASSVSLFWFAVAVAIIIVAAGALGALVGSGAAADDRRKLETELEDTYRRLREAQAAARPPVVVTMAGDAAALPSTVVALEAPETAAVGPDAPEPGTVVALDAPEPGTAVEPPAVDAQTMVGPAPDEPETAVASAPDEPQTAVGPAPDEPHTAVVTEQPGETDAGESADATDDPQAEPGAETAEAPPPAPPPAS